MNVVSDMNGTVTTGSPVLGLVKWVGHHQSALRANLYLGRILPSYLLAMWKLIDRQKWGQRLMFSALPLIKDPSFEGLDQMGRWSVEFELWPKRRHDILERLADHIAAGAHVYLASSVYEPTVKAFAERIGARWIGTPLRVENGRAVFAEPLAAEDRKADKVLAQLGVDRVDAAYGDTWADIPLLELADRPVAVYPDEQLKTIALDRGWEIIGERNTK